MLDAAFISHIIFWVIGAIVLGGAVSSFAAMFFMGRTSYRKD